jgi:F-type H+-transporting ATPase subunit gamma
MANLLHIRRRIRSVKNTQQITKAMKMVSAARLKRSQERVTAARPFAKKMIDVLGNLAASAGEDFSHPLLNERGDERYLIVLITSDKGLCGAFNANLIKATQNFMREHASQQIELMPVGRKGRDFFRRFNHEFFGEDYTGLTGKGRVEFSEAAAIAKEIIKRFTEDETLDKVFIVYNEFKTVLQQHVQIDQLLPVPRIANSEANTDSGNRTDYLYEQPPAEIFGRLLPSFVETQIYRALLESIASEQGARMTAMDAASKNAGELISTLTLNMNRIRQAAITNEIIEIVSGAAAL